MDKSAAQSAAGQAEQALCNARRGTALGDPGKDAGLFATAGIPAQEEMGRANSSDSHIVYFKP